MLHSALLNVMVKAAAGRPRPEARFRRGREAAGLAQGPGKLRPAADKRAEETLLEELSKARPGYGFLGEEGGRAKEPTRASLDRRPARRHHELSARHSAIRHLDRASARRHLIAGLIYNPVNDELFTAERGKGAFLNDRASASPRAEPQRCVIACGLPHIGRGDHELSRGGGAAARSRASAASARRRSTSPGSRRDASTPIGSATCRLGHGGG